MKINSTGNINNLPIKENLEITKFNNSEDKVFTPAAIYLESDTEDLIHVYHKSTLDNLQMVSEESFNNLKQSVLELLEKQGKDILISNQVEFAEEGQSIISEARELIGQDGKLGIEALSDTIIDFAEEILAGDNPKPETLKRAIIKSFIKAEHNLGKLPNISLKTRDKTIEKLNKLIIETKNPFYALKEMVQDMIGRQRESSLLLDPKELVVEVDEATLIEVLSDSIVDFAKEISGQDKTKLEILKQEIIKGFNEVEKTFGKLPDISIKTRHRIIYKLDNWGYGWIQRTMINLQNPILPNKNPIPTIPPKILTPIILIGILLLIIFISQR